VSQFFRPTNRGISVAEHAIIRLLHHLNIQLYYPGVSGCPN